MIICAKIQFRYICNWIALRYPIFIQHTVEKALAKRGQSVSVLRHCGTLRKGCPVTPEGCIYTNCGGRNHCIIQDGLHLGEDYYWLIRGKRLRLGSRLVTGWFIGISVCSPLRCNERTVCLAFLGGTPCNAWNTAILDFDVSPRIAAATGRGFLLPWIRLHPVHCPGQPDLISFQLFNSHSSKAIPSCFLGKIIFQGTFSSSVGKLKFENFKTVWYSRGNLIGRRSCCGKIIFIPILNVKIRFGDCAGRAVAFELRVRRSNTAARLGTSVSPIDVPSPFDVIYGQGPSAELLVLTRYTNSLNSSDVAVAITHTKKKKTVSIFVYLIKLN